MKKKYLLDKAKCKNNFGVLCNLAEFNITKLK